MKTNSILYIILTSLLWGGIASADPKPKSGNRAYVSIIALSAHPLPRYRKSTAAEIGSSEKRAAMVRKQGGALYKNYRSTKNVFLPPAVDSIPPSALLYTTEKSKNLTTKEKKKNRLIVGFNRMIPPKSIPLLLPIKFTKKNEEETYFGIPAIRIPSQFLVFLTPSGDGKTPWEDAPRTTILRIDSDDMKNYNAYVKNFSSKPVAFILGKEGLAQPVVLQPGKSKKLTINPAVKMQRFIAIDNNKNTLIRKSIRFRKQALHVYAFYNANPKTNKGRSIGVVSSTVQRVR